MVLLTSRRVICLLIASLFLPGYSRLVAAASRVEVNGHIWSDATPICALVLANGQSTFSCNPDGPFELTDIPMDANGEVAVQVFATGFLPFKQTVTPSGSVPSVSLPQIDMLPVSGGNFLHVNASYTPLEKEGWVSVNGSVKDDKEKPVCALVLVNGQNMFSCDENLGSFSTQAPTDYRGDITLMVFADGFQPYRVTTVVNPDSDGDGVTNHQDEDDDNDGILDQDDPCPLYREQDCPIELSESDTISVDGREWLQPDLFRGGLSWRDIDLICPFGVCVEGGILKGIDMTGWKWATTDDVNALFNSYIGAEGLGPGPSSFSDLHEDFTLLMGYRFFYAEDEPSIQAGVWRPTYRWSSSAIFAVGFTFSTSTPENYTQSASVFFEYSGDGLPATTVTTGHEDTESCAWIGVCLVEALSVGAWFYRTP